MVFSVGDNISDTGNMRFVASKLESIKKSIEKYKRAKTELSYTDIWGAFGNMMDYIQFFNMGTAKSILNILDDLAAHENHIECYRLATDSEKQKMIKALKKSENPKAKEYLKRFFGIKEEPKYDFKPFDKVLVRKEGNKKWNISLFAREIVDDYNGLPYKYECSNGTLWDYCIPFEGNGCLLETAENPEK